MNTSGLLQETRSVHDLMKVGFMLTLQETRSVYDLMNRQKLNLLLIFIFNIVCQVTIFNFHINWLVFLDISKYTRHNGGLGTAKTPNYRI